MKTIGIIGTGAIAPAYMQGMSAFAEQVRVLACADINRERAEAFAMKHQLQAMSIDTLLARDEIDIVLNLTIPAVHAEVSMQILEAGKHAYLEKPLAVTLEDGRAVMALAAEKGLQVACAPDTFLGSGGQTARRLIDEGAIGRPVSTNVFMMGHGPDPWHPNPFFYYVEGGGPMLDMGPYYLTALINLLGSVTMVAGMTNRAYDNRTAGHEAIRGQNIPVSVDTHIAGLLRFESGAVGTIITSFDTWRSELPNIEIHGTDGSLGVPDPNGFDGDVRLFTPQAGQWQQVEPQHPRGLLRGVGVADLAQALEANETQRASGAMALHVLEIMNAFTVSSQEGRHVQIESRVERPRPMPKSL